MIRVLVAAASGAARASLESLVRSAATLALAGSETSLPALAEAAARLRPDVVLAEMDFHADDGLAEMIAPAAVVLLVSDPAGTWLADALRSGIRAALAHDAPAAEIVAAVEAAAAGLVTVHAGDIGVLLPSGRLEQPAAEIGESLTPRELEVFAMLAEGAGNKTIAWKLGISEHTVKFHVASILAKLNAGSRTEAVAIGMRKGLILL